MTGVVARVLAFVSLLPLPATGQLVPDSPTAKAEITIGDQKFVFKSGGCLATADSFMMALGDMTKSEHFELSMPHPFAALAKDKPKPTKDGTYTGASMIVVPPNGPSTGTSWHAGGRNTRDKPDLTVILKNNRKAGEFSGTTDRNPRLPIKGTFSC